MLGNVVGRLKAAADAPVLLTGSHYDTVRNAGKYDGRLGIVLPIAVAAALKRDGVQLPFTLEIIAFAEEEGVRFGSTYLGSSALAGRFDGSALDRKDETGATLADALGTSGADPATISALARDPAKLLGYVEVHIEQGPVLLDAGLPLGVVTAIAGNVRRLVTVTGTAGHAGTVPMTLRRDAAAAAAEMILAVERRCATAPGLVGTVGRVEVPNGAVNVIPGSCRFSLDIRAGEDAIRDAAVADVEAEHRAIAARRGVGIEITELLRGPAAPCAPAMRHRLAASISRLGEKPRELPSGAGHDAAMFASVTPTGMLFVRCGNGGISHNPLETMTADDAGLAALTFRDFLLNFDRTP